MRIKLLSDLHFEFYKKQEEVFSFIDSLSNDVDVLVLAGDICMAKNSLAWLERICSRFGNVIYVLGNHEYYRSEFSFIQRRIAGLKISNLHYLENSTVEIKGQRFIGCTLWYDGGRNAIEYESNMNDFRCIYSSTHKFSNFIYPYARNSRQYLEDNVKSTDVVVTHMMPSDRCVDSRFQSNPWNCFYVHNCDSIIDNAKPKLWLHGHSHNHFDKLINKTRIIRNPFGYPKETDVDFKKDFVIEI